MKKLLAILLVLSMMLCAFAGCGQKEEPVAETPAEEPATTGVANPMVPSDVATIQEKFGATFDEPTGAGYVEYYIINDSLAEMQFTLGDGSTNCVARLQPADNFTDISGAYYEWTLDEPDSTLSNFIGQLRSYVVEGDEDDVMNYLWYDGYDGMMYSFLATGADLNGLDPIGVALELMGDRYIDYNKDYTGSYEDADFDTVDITKTADGYDMVIGITRLCEIEATGYNMDGAVEFTGIDPNGEDITGIFYPADDTYTLKFTTSQWDYLSEGTEFEGFTLK